MGVRATDDLEDQIMVAGEPGEGTVDDVQARGGRGENLYGTGALAKAYALLVGPR